MSPSPADLALFGLDSGADLASLKRSYRRRVKELHPDTATAGEIIQNHLRFVAVCAAYRRLSAILSPPGEASPGTASGSRRPSGRASGSRTAPPREASPGAASPGAAGGAADGESSPLAPHADPAWVYYKRGSDFFSRIHPSSWNLGGFITVDSKLPHDREAQRETAARVRELVRLFPKAYLCFSAVAADYPDSPWADDAREKMRLIEERVSRYRNIIESFSAWSEYPEREKRDFAERREEDIRRYEGFDPESRKRWEGKG